MGPTGSASIANQFLAAAVRPRRRSAWRLMYFAVENRTDLQRGAARASAPTSRHRQAGCGESFEVGHVGGGNWCVIAEGDRCDHAVGECAVATGHTRSCRLYGTME